MMKTRLAGVCFATVLAAVAATGIGDASARSQSITSGEFLGYNEAQQGIHVKQMMDGQSTLVSECAPNESVEQVTEDLVEFMRMNPQYLQRPASLSFEEMMMRKCKSAQ